MPLQDEPLRRAVHVWGALRESVDPAGFESVNRQIFILFLFDLVDNVM
jgi:hypothetical protein